MADSGEFTGLIQSWQSGDEAALDKLTPIIYDELKRLARGYMRQEAGGHTLQATALVNEAFLQLAGSDVEYAGRGHFIAAAARMMRHTLVDHARSKHRRKRGGVLKDITLDEESAIDIRHSPRILDLDMALTKLEQRDSGLATIVELVFFGGLTYKEAAHHLGVSRSTFYEDLVFAKAWLKKEMQ